MKLIVSLAILALATATPAGAAENCSVTDQPRDATKVEGKRLTVVAEGKGPDLILIPGLGTPRDVWNETVDAFAGCFTVHSVQLRGFGDDAGINASGPVLDPFVRELADYIDDEIVNKGRKPPLIVGHSMGGLAGLMIAQQDPHLVTRLVMVDSLPSFAVLIPGLAGADPETIASVAAKMRDTIAADFGKPTDPAAIDASIASLALKPESLARMRSWSAAADARVVAQVAYEDVVIDMRPKLGQVTAPVLVLAAWHQGMPFTEAQVQGFFEGQFAGTPKVTVSTVAQAAHFIMLDQPETFQKALWAVLERGGD